MHPRSLGQGRYRDRIRERPQSRLKTQDGLNHLNRSPEPRSGSDRLQVSHLKEAMPQTKTAPGWRRVKLRFGSTEAI